jgi:predicted ATPase
VEEAYLAGNPRWSGHPRMVVLSGCSGGGKSTLLAALARKGYTTFPEPGRQVVREENLVGGPALPEADPVRFAERCIARASYFFNVAQPERGPVFFDRGIVDTATAMERAGTVPRWAEEAVRLYRYAPRVFLVPPWKELFERDEERRHSFREAEAEYEALLASYPAKGYEPVIVPKGPVASRIAFVEAELRDA